MIKIALKHWIYEVCINILFDKIIKNFCSIPKIKFKVGDKLSYLALKIPDNRWLVYIYDAVVTELHHTNDGYDSFNVKYKRKDTYKPINYRKKYSMDTEYTGTEPTCFIDGEEYFLESRYDNTRTVSYNILVYYNKI